MANAIVNKAKEDILTDYVAGKTFKMMLLDDNHTPNIDTEEFIDDVSANEVSGTGYTAGGETITNVSVTVDDTNDRAYIDFDNVVWSSATITYRYAYLYEDTGTPATSTIIGYYDPGSNQTATAGTLTIAPAAPASGGALYLA